MGIFDWCCGPRRKDGEVSAPSAWISAATVGDLNLCDLERQNKAGTQGRLGNETRQHDLPRDRQPATGSFSPATRVLDKINSSAHRPPNCAGQQWAAFLSSCHRQPRQPPCPGDRMTNPTDGLHVSGCARSVHGRDADRVWATPLLACQLCLHHARRPLFEDFLLA